MNETILTTLWHARPRLFNNPVIKRELIERLRKPSSFVYLLLLLSLLLLGIIIAWHGHTQRQIVQEETVRRFFFLFLGIEAAFVIFIVPFLSATSINLEFERRSWDNLFTTHISLPSILLGKLSASTFFVWFLIASLLPFYGVLFSLGSVSPKEMIVAFLLLTELILTVSLIGLICSALFRQSILAVMMTYIASFFYMVLPFVFCARFADILGFPLLYGIPAVISPITPFDLFISPMPKFYLSPLVRENVLYLHVIHVLVAFLGLFRLCQACIHTKSEAFGQNPFIKRMEEKLAEAEDLEEPIGFDEGAQLIEDHHNPVIHKDRLILNGNFQLRNRMIFIALFAMGVCLVVLHDSPRIFHYIAFWAIFFSPLLIIPYAVFALRHEKDLNTWDLLCTTTLQPKEILQGKMYNGIQLFIMRFFSVFALPLLLGMIYPKGDTFIYFATLITSFIWGLFYLSIGMLIALRSRSTTRAYVQSMIFALIFLIVPPILIGMLPLDSNPSTLLTYLSPSSLFVQYFSKENEGVWLHYLIVHILTLLTLSFIALAYIWHNLRMGEE